MYLEVKDVKKSYGSDAGYTQVLKGVNERFGQIDAP